MPRTGSDGRQANPREVTQTQDQIDRAKVHKPFDCAKPAISSPYGEPNHGSPPHTHRGDDYPMNSGTTLFALVRSHVDYITDNWDHGGLVILRSLEDAGKTSNGGYAIKKGDRFGYGHVQPGSIKVSQGQEVAPGTPLAKSNHPAPHCHFWMQRPADPNKQDGNRSTKSAVDYAYGGTATDVADTGGGTGGGTGTGPGDATGSGYNTEQIAKAAAFSSILSVPGGLNSMESQALGGQRSMMNDQSLFPFIKQICGASLRSFMSMPNGKFYAFYPDYFGGFGRAPYWEISDVEIISGKIDLSDDTLATHVFVVGDTSATGATGGGIAGYGTIDWLDKIQSTGVINIFNAFATGFLNGRSAEIVDTGKSQKNSNKTRGKSVKPVKGATPDNPTGKYQTNTTNPKSDELTPQGALNFLNKYGARPVYKEEPAVRSPIYETYLAFQQFCLLWASQFQTTFEFTFMPELYPGGIVSFPDHGLQCYVDEVIHSGSYESGFSTVAKLSAPSALRDGDGNPDKDWIHSGMIRAFVNNPENFKDTKTPPKPVVTPPSKKPKLKKPKP